MKGLVSWLARQPPVGLDGPGDPRVGIAGASYGGALALLAAADDHRIDAVAPQIAWSNLAGALFPNARPARVSPGRPAGCSRSCGPGSSLPGAPADRGGGAGGSGGRRAVRPVPARCCAPYQRAATAGRANASAVSLLERSSPSRMGGRIEAPTLVIQGENDSLFAWTRPRHGPGDRGVGRRSAWSGPPAGTTAETREQPGGPAPVAVVRPLAQGRDGDRRLPAFQVTR